MPFLSVNAMLGKIFVSDARKDTIMCLKFDGTMCYQANVPVQMRSVFAIKITWLSNTVQVIHNVCLQAIPSAIEYRETYVYMVLIVGWLNSNKLFIYSMV